MPDYMSEAGLTAHLQVQADHIDEYAAGINVNAAAITQLKGDAANMRDFIEFCAAVDNYKTTMFGIKRAFIRGDIGTLLGTFPDAPTTPTLTLLAAVEKRSRERDQRFLRSEGITEAARLALDLVDDALRLDPSAVKPTIKLTAAAGDYKFTVEVSHKGDADMFNVEARRMNAEKWTELKSGTGRSVVVTVAPTVAGQSERLEIRVQLIQKNENYGTPSAPQYVTVNS